MGLLADIAIPLAAFAVASLIAAAAGAVDAGTALGVGQIALIGGAAYVLLRR